MGRRAGGEGRGDAPAELASSQLAFWKIRRLGLNRTKWSADGSRLIGNLAPSLAIDFSWAKLILVNHAPAPRYSCLQRPAPRYQREICRADFSAMSVISLTRHADAVQVGLTSPRRRATQLHSVSQTGSRPAVAACGPRPRLPKNGLTADDRVCNISVRYAAHAPGGKAICRRGLNQPSLRRFGRAPVQEGTDRGQAQLCFRQ
jgi:hypothetical protein